jgi:hypothetical protein
MANKKKPQPQNQWTNPSPTDWANITATIPNQHNDTNNEPTPKSDEK